MSTTQVAHSTRKIATALSTEVRSIGADRRGFCGASIASCFKNVVCVDLRMSLLELPQELYEIYDEATTRMAVVYDIDTVVHKIDRIGGTPA